MGSEEKARLAQRRMNMIGLAIGGVALLGGLLVVCAGGIGYYVYKNHGRSSEKEVSSSPQPPVSTAAGSGGKSGDTPKLGGPDSDAMTLQAFFLQRPTEPKSVRTTCKMTNKYIETYNFVDSSWYAFQLNGPASETLYGYALKESPEGKKMYELFKGGETKTLTLTLFYADFRGYHQRFPENITCQIKGVASEK